MVGLTTNAQNTSFPETSLAVAGLSHGHSHWIFQDEFKGDYAIVGIYEPNISLASKYQIQYGMDSNLFYTNLEEMLDNVKPHGVLAFGSVYEHLQVVEAAAPRGIHVMVEKPLATSWEHAKKMEKAAQDHGIYLLTNYETSWYPSTEATYQYMLDGDQFGPLKKAVFHHGHKGPQEIGVGPEFLEWLTDPILNGGGVLMDFGCYGANIMTYLLEGQLPHSITAITQNHKPEIYTKVEDEATIVLEYDGAQAIIQASWNWPYDRKDMEVYGTKGYIIAPDKNHIKFRSPQTNNKLVSTPLRDIITVYSNPFQYFVEVISGKINIPSFGLYSIENNMVVVQILEAAKLSVLSGKTVRLPLEK
ncbi:oxidoreductase [Anditalea andensis]|uniref:Oxidoreductase n=2 Tax=Anditalea andensis TaxID=1048983 RepID=A0A074KYB6_9BACT|nr:oxidoreductase [Anditalea andensis]